MPLQINVGLNRKASKDYQSTGVSINIQAELDATLLTRPEELQRQVADLYAQAEAALDRQVGQPERAKAPQVGRQAAPAVRPATAAPAPHTGYTAGRQPPAAQQGARPSATAGRVGGGNTPPPATDSQLKAIRAIAQSVGVNPDAEADALGVKFPISRGDASRFIDHLKAMQPPQRAAA